MQVHCCLKRQSPDNVVCTNPNDCKNPDCNPDVLSWTKTGFLSWSNLLALWLRLILKNKTQCKFELETHDKFVNKQIKVRANDLQQLSVTANLPTDVMWMSYLQWFRMSACRVISYFYVSAKLCGNVDSLLEPPQQVKPKQLGKWKTEPLTLTFSETYIQ